MTTVVSRPAPAQRALTCLALVATLAFGGCAVAPPSQVATTPAVAAPSQWAETSPGHQGTVGDAWWRDFGDPVLDRLVDSALDANRDLKVAAARLAQARALGDSAEAERRPRLDAMARGERGRENSVDPRAERSGVGLRAAWEVDLFGRGALLVDAARSDSAVAREALRAARIALAADVSTAYFELRTLERRSALKREALEVAQRQAVVAARKFAAGQVTALDVERWRAELAQEQASLALLDGEHRVRLHQLALLVGSSQAPELGAQAVPVALPAPPATVLPATLLDRRPDVQRQARALDAALARAGAARKEVYPRLQIEWAGTKERLAAIGDGAAPRVAVGYGVSVTLPILDGGRIRANVAVHDARAQEAMAEYEKAMLAALVDVETSLARWSASDRSMQEWQRAEAAGKVAARNAARLYDAGQADMSDVLAARHAHLRSRDALETAIGAQWEAAVGLRRTFAGAV
ncbi:MULTISPECIES: efflux transporter outer membrane subunit [Burkholderia cepacia complex]|uniref:efflux transporter outer membrane subunit n=1 Tax=Burkholderia cepacia complex TaxID=87882 RepID=UPI0009BE3AD8|nr:MULTISPECIES: TolC family protein [Burkholderia cepacia complex]MCA7882136.1 TolC family protein [Burkholderia contaminans]MCA8024573.1 TolC family protein [Burkholderia cepacia]RQT04623.1 TolC family protein [Burkholderia contaminans]RRA22441.1 TolC family protein [Burkholderia cepacia]VWC61844.1 RND efflux system outer membrane lipoprotein [Burkholderia contaminans]